jgi:uncharacterized membrane protein
MGETDPLAAVLDTLIPPSADGRLPGAGEIGLADALREATAGARAVVDQGLAAADAAAGARGAPRFAALALEDRVAVLRELEQREPAFLPGLLFHLYAAYYRHPRVMEALGLEARPPHPRGYELEPGDLAALERVRARGPLYREV